MKSEIFNAKVRDTFIGIEDHGIFTAFIQLDLSDGTTQAFGTYDLRTHDAAFKFVAGCLRICESESWEKLKGSTLRARRDDERLTAIGKLLKDDWFEPAYMWNSKDTAA